MPPKFKLHVIITWYLKRLARHFYFKAQKALKGLRYHAICKNVELGIYIVVMVREL